MFVTVSCKFVNNHLPLHQQKTIKMILLTTAICAIHAFSLPINNGSIVFKKLEMDHNNRPLPHRSKGLIVSNVHANICKGNVLLSFDDNTYQDVNITIACNATVLYFNHYAHKSGEDIVLPLPVVEGGEYTITIQKGMECYVATFMVED